MHRRTRAAALLCGPLVAGCGAATRLNFASHSRPATPLAISVFLGTSGRPAFDPASTHRIRPGAVVFEITNQSASAARFAVRKDGHPLARTPAIAPGQAAQLKTSLSGTGNAFDTSGVGRSGPHRFAIVTDTELNVAGPPRTGNNDVTQP